MAITKEQILEEFRRMPESDRVELLEDLRQVAVDDDLTAEQVAELKRRVEAIDRGEVKLIPGEQVTQELFARLRRR